MTPNVKLYKIEKLIIMKGLGTLVYSENTED